MVKFGQRLQEELMRDGWEAHYVQYKPLKKIISAISKNEVAGEMIQAFDRQATFMEGLQASVEAAAGFYTERAHTVLAQAVRAREGTAAMLCSPSSPSKQVKPLDEPLSLDKPLESIQGSEALDSLAMAREDLVDVREFAMVNREAVRKIIKKYRKKISAGTEEMHAQLESVLQGTALDEVHETAQKLSVAMGLLVDTEAQPKQRTTYMALYALATVVVVCCTVVLVAQPARLPKLSVLGVYASVLTAVANGANDIANSVGTSVGAKALTLKQAIVLGLIAEALGAMTLGSLVAKTISKGVISPDIYAAEGCEGVLKFGVSMVCVLCGTGLTTLLATLYGLPISASHGVIGGLIAVGLVSQGPGSLGVDAIARTMIAWVASPMIGAISAAVCYWIILYVVHRSHSPASRAVMLQPFFIAITVTVASGFIIIKGPKALRIQPVGIGVVASIAIGAGVGLITLVLRVLRGSALGKQIEGPFKRVTSVVGKEDSTTTMTTSSGEPNAPIPGEPVTGSPVASAMSEAARAEGAEKPFVPLLILSALTVAFAHGANDVGNAVGPLAAVFEATINGEIAGTPEMPIWVLAIGSAGFVVGIAVLGSRTIATVGGKITTLTPSKSFSVQIGAAVAVLSSTVLGLAVSTSHCLVGSVVGVGIAAKISRAGGSLNKGILLKIFIGWGVTIPLSMLVAIIFYAIIAPQYGYTADELLALNQTANATCY